MPTPEDDQLEPLITECPGCHTRFRVSDAHLQRAGGRVRCGACLTVFDGVAHLTLESARLFADEEQASRALDDLLDELSGQPSRLTAAPEAAAAPPAAPPPARPPWRNAGTPNAPIFAGFEDAPAAVPALDDTRRDARETAADEGRTREAGDTAADLECAAPRQTPESAEPAEPVESAGPTESAEPERPAGRDGFHFTVVDEQARREQRGLEEAPARAPFAPGGARAAAGSAADSAGPAGEPTAPVRFGEPRRGRPWVWLGIALGLVLLVAQVLWLQFDQWATTPTGRAVYGPVCGVLGCELPVQRDTSQLATRNLAVRSHPSQPGTLLVNAVVVNQADFAQPFPVLELRFTTVRGILVAGRRFRPEEYLSGDARGMELIPPRTPVQIELTIEDPGPDAVNYFLKLR